MINWTDKKKFAFTIVDDTDCSTLENAPIIYDYLNECGIKTTKSIWLFDGEKREDNSTIIGSSCDDNEYLKWVQDLSSKGFEIALHSSTWSSSKREKIKEAFDLFNKYFGKDPSILVQHTDNKECEAIYWGENRVSGVLKLLYKLIMRINGVKKNIYLGDNKSSEYFWGDICQEKVKYVRNFIYPEINTLNACPYMPYHDPKRPFVNYWFASTEANEVKTFNKCLSITNQNKLEKERGACIIYTHFGCGFVEKGNLNNTFVKLIKNLSERDGWFVPATQILDHILLSKSNSNCHIKNSERIKLEIKWLKHKMKIGTT